MKPGCQLVLLFLCIPIILAAQYSYPVYSVHTPASSSVLASGKWFKIKIYSDGIYQLSYDDIKNMGFDDPSAIRLFGNGGSMVSMNNADSRYDDLIENAIYMNKGSDGIFNKGDYILFYGHGPVYWEYNVTTSMFEQRMNSYSSAAYYFLTTDAGTGKKIIERPVYQATPSREVTSFDDYVCHERNNINLLGSGRQWFGEKINDTPYDTSFVLDKLAANSRIKVLVNVVSRSASTRSFTIYGNNNFLGTIQVSGVNLRNTTGAYANQRSGLFNLLPSGSELNVRIDYDKSSFEDEAYLDYITVNSRKQLYFTGDAMFFRDRSSTNINAIARYIVENCNQQTEIWDITNPFDIVKIPAQLSGTALSFIDSTLRLKQYVVVEPQTSTFKKPVTDTRLKDLGIVPNQNLHGSEAVQMLIVTHPLFKEAADSIATFHRTQDNLTVTVVLTSQIYNEFSSGATDISAIRDFVKMMYDRAEGNSSRLKYLLLMGDGSFNNIDQTNGNSNFIPTYQSVHSLNASYSYVSDDFFGLLENAEGGSEEMEDYTLDIGVGRLPVKTAAEALSVYNKIKNYRAFKNQGDWQNNILFVADDEDDNMHMQQADELAEWVDQHYPEFAIKKVFLDAYPQEASSMGARYPDVNKSISENIEKGILIFNYTGHGGELGLTMEEILVSADIEKMKNAKNLPLFITATCEFSRFDNMKRDENGNLSESTSAGELSLLNNHGGSIALITTTRIVYSNENHQLNQKFYEVAFSRDADGHHYTLGDIIKMTKNELDSRNKLNFILLGDPALKLAVPELSVATDSINHLSVSDPPDTLRAFSKVRITGHIEDPVTHSPVDYNGKIYPSVFDKKKTITTLGNDLVVYDPDELMQFNTREDLIYRGTVSVVNGRFSFEFIVPKDITYSIGQGRIIYFAYNEDTDAHGQFGNFMIGGTEYASEVDLEGPVISLFMNDSLFRSSGITSPDPVIYAKISDKSGINMVGNGIGHDITGTVDGDITRPVILNQYFTTNLNDYTSGTLAYPMEGLEEGVHSLTVKVWDIYNNSSEQTIQFRVVSGNGIIITNAGNYPNPASDHTTFSFEHNSAGEDLMISISVYDMTGRLVSVFTNDIPSTGFHSATKEWDLRDLYGNQLKQGIYPYRIRISDNQGNIAESHQKLVVIR